jgi:hypothetical protein
MSRSELDWSTATVSAQELIVELTQRPSKQWRVRFRALADRLQPANAAWDSVTAKGDRLIVSGIAEGAERDVHHFLESLVLETNASEPEREHENDAPAASDKRMTEAFRAFSGA